MAAGGLWLLRHERWLLAGSLLFVVALSWAYLLNGAGMLQEMGEMLMPMSSGPWSPAHAALVYLMWAVMMAAMMLPGAAPMILLYDAIARRNAASGGSLAAAGSFSLGYVAVWSVFSLIAVALQFGLEQAALLSPMMQTTSVALAGAVLLLAGLYQWTPYKQACLQHCRTPLEFLSTHWRKGAGGAFAMGWRHGVDCLGCCWLLMLLLFVGGVMNLAWIGGLAVYVLIEKLAPAGPWVARGSGVLLMAWGLATWLSL